MKDLSGDAALFLGRLPGVHSAAVLHRPDLEAVLHAEESYERAAAVPILNLGVRHGLERRHVVAILKDRTFRRPPSPTLYLVEDGDAPESEKLCIGESVYHILGQELIPGDRDVGPGAVSISDTFFLYPQRRKDPGRPSRFLLPPVAFPELEAGAWTERIRSVVSASPSPLGDAALRGICGFPDDPALATLLVGFDPASVPLEEPLSRRRAT